MTTRYQMLVDDTMSYLVKRILTYIQNEGLQENQCFYISFRTNDPGVVISKKITSKFAKEVTIILQYQYENLQVFENKFSVDISFSGVRETIEVTYSSIIHFSDSSINVHLQFRDNGRNQYTKKDSTSLPKEVLDIRENKSALSKRSLGKVIDIEQFRNKY